MKLAPLLLLTLLAPACTAEDGGTFHPGGRALGEAVSTVAEYITVACDREVQACLIPCPADDLYVAINPWDYAGSAACGACMEVVGPLDTVTVLVTQNCGAACAEDEIELSETAFGRIADVAEGRADVTWRLVACSVTGPIAFHFEPESTEWWVSIQVRNQAVPVRSLELLQSDGTWRDLPRRMHNYFEADATPGPGPYTLRATSIDGRQLVEEGIPLRPGSLVQGTQQFE
jgi:expansin (peptidoglycan-binding protein)